MTVMTVFSARVITNELSLSDVSVQVSWICEWDMAFALKPDGGVGGDVGSIGGVITVLKSNRPPVTVLPASEGVGIVESRIAYLISGAVASGWVEAYKAIAPVTCGVAIDVPLAIP
jgi:hypothetical protein